MKAARARVVTMYSGAHRQSPVHFDDLNFRKREYDKWKAYAQSKTANVLFTVALDRIGEPHGIRAFAVHPGRIETNLQRYLSMQELQARGLRDDHGEIPPDQLRLHKTPEQGAATTVWCAVSPQLDHIGGVYCENADVAEAVPTDHTALDGVLPWAIDPEAADSLWDVSQRMTDVVLPR